MSEQNIIKAIEIEIAGVTVKVTPEQLENLHKAIGALLNLKTEKVIERNVIRDIYVPYSRPYWSWNPNHIFCGSGSAPTPADKYTISYSASQSTASLQIR